MSIPVRGLAVGLRTYTLTVAAELRLGGTAPEPVTKQTGHVRPPKGGTCTILA